MCKCRCCRTGPCRCKLLQMKLGTQCCRPRPVCIFVSSCFNVFDVRRTLNAWEHEHLAGSSVSWGGAFASYVHMPFILQGAELGPGHLYSQLGPTKSIGHWHVPAAQVPPLQNTPDTRPHTAAAGTAPASSIMQQIRQACLCWSVGMLLGSVAFDANFAVRSAHCLRCQ